MHNNTPAGPKQSGLSLTTYPVRRGVYATLLLSVLVLPVTLVMTSFPADAETIPVSHHFDMSAGSLESALIAFSTHTGITISFTPDVVDGLKSAGLRGEFTAGEALNRLLAGTTLTARKSGNGTYSIVDEGKAGVDDATVSPPAEVEGDAMQETVVVIGRPIESYMAVDAMTGTKTNALLKDLPLSVSVVPTELIEDRSINHLGEALDTIASAQRKMGYGGTQNFGAFLRGFDAGFLTLRNGIRDAGNLTLRDAANVERFEVLKGPGSVLYGAVTPGGITNTITKKPSVDPLARVALISGSDDFYRCEFDLGGPVTDDVSYRLNMAYEDANSYRDLVENDSYFIAPVVAWRINDSTQWVFEIEHKHSDFTWDLGLPRDPAIFDLPVSRFLGEADGINAVDSTYAASTLEHRFNDSWTFRQTAAYLSTHGDYKLRSFWQMADDRTVLRVAYDTEEYGKRLVMQNDVIGKFDYAGLAHQLVFGVEYNRSEGSTHFFQRELASMDIFNPVYGARPQGSGFTLIDSEGIGKGYGIYIQDLISVGKPIKILIGARYDSLENRSLNLRRNSRSSTEDNALSPQVGIVYQPYDGTSFYASYGESFLPNRGMTVDGRALEPERAQQFEVGVKRFWLDGSLLTTLALYEISKHNVVTSDPENPTFKLQTGEQRGRGVELDFSGSPVQGLDLVLSTSYIETEVTQDNRFKTGSELPGTAHFSSSFWGKYTLQNGLAKGLGMGIGIIYVGERQSSFIEPQQTLFNPLVTLPSYSRFDAMLKYPFTDFFIQFNLKNITDEKIYDLTGTTVLPQAPRSFSMRLSYEF